MTLPKWLIYTIVFSVLIGAISHHFDLWTKKPNASMLVSQIPENQLLLNFEKAINSGDRKSLKNVFKLMNSSEETLIFSNAIVNGFITRVWGIETQRGAPRLVIECHVKYDKTFSIQENTRALLILHLNGSEWVLDYIFPGAMLLPSTSISSN